MISGIGLPELLIVFVIALLVLGPKRLPEVGKSVGNGIREFRDSLNGTKKDLSFDVDDDDEDEASRQKVASKAGLSG